MEALLASHDVHAVDGVALDLGVSSMQLDAPESGFSFQHDGPLDMRMDAAGTSAADIVNGMGEAELADILFRYGEERRSRAIARAIVAARREAPITRTRQLAAIVARAAPKGAQAIHPATRTFQALRVYVNRELEELALGLGAAQALLKPGGRLAVVSFHSLEDRIVKRFLAERTGAAPRASRHAPGGAAEPDAGAAPSFRLLARGGETPDAAETAANPRARSARLRAAERTAGALRPVDPVALGVPRLAEKRGRP
jgi:16S rRNA (cytosine1402-N4)-methyltransferase